MTEKETQQILNLYHGSYENGSKKSLSLAERMGDKEGKWDLYRCAIEALKVIVCELPYDVNWEYVINENGCQHQAIIDLTKEALNAKNNRL